MNDIKIKELEADIKTANVIRDENIQLLRALVIDTHEVPLKLNAIKVIDELLKSKENSGYNSIKASLLNADVNSNVDYKRAALEMLKTVSPSSIANGKVTINPNIDLELEQRFANSENNTISEHEIVLED